jgi:hypothetical protein
MSFRNVASIYESLNKVLSSYITFRVNTSARVFHICSFIFFVSCKISHSVSLASTVLDYSWNKEISSNLYGVVNVSPKRLSLLCGDSLFALYPFLVYGMLWNANLMNWIKKKSTTVCHLRIFQEASTKVNTRNCVDVYQHFRGKCWSCIQTRRDE